MIRQVKPKPWELVLFGALFFWIAGISFFSQVSSWTVEQLLLITGIAWSSWAWVVVSVFQGALLLVPAGLLAALAKNSVLRQIAVAWALGAVYVLIMAPMRLVQAPSVLVANAFQIIIATIGIILLLLLHRGLGGIFRQGGGYSDVWLALLIASIASYPWLMWGALGSLMDTLFNLMASLLLGLLVALILHRFVYKPILTSEVTTPRGLLLGGLAGIGLLIEMSSALGFGGLQLLLLIVVPSFALAAAAVDRFSNPGLESPNGSVIAVAVLIGLVVATPAMMIDADEMALVLAVGTRDLLQWALYAAFVSATIGWFVGVTLVIFRSRVRTLHQRPVLPFATLTSLFLGVILYFAVGQPGFHGDQLFVILKDQVDLSDAVEIDDLEARRSFAFRTLVAHADDTQRDLRTTLDRLGIGYQAYYLVNGLSVDGGPLLSLWLRSRPEVDRVLHNPVLRPLRAPSPEARGGAEPPSHTPWNLELIGADRVWRDFGVTGEGVIIGQSDSGIDGKHPELAGAYRGRIDGDDYNWYDPWDGSDQPTDSGGHGTHTLGTILGATTGVAPGAEWLGCVNLDRNLANPSLYLDCLQFMLAPFPQGKDPFLDGDPSAAADVLNNSWGCPPVEGCDPDALSAAAQALRDAGIFVVVSAGNQGPFCESVSDPLAIYDEVLSVGAVDNEGLLAFFSSVGPVTVDGSQRTKPDILAPGVSVLSAFPGGTYEYLDGTSMAGPHVAGVIALMWSASPDLKGDIDRTEEILIGTATKYEGAPPKCGEQRQAPYNGIGYGIVDAYRAVEAALDVLD